MSSLTDFLEARINDDEGVASDWRHQGSAKVEVFGGGTGYLTLVNPHRVQAECEAKREVMRLHRECERQGYDNAAAYMLDALRALALPYASHPNYREEWRP